MIPTVEFYQSYFKIQQLDIELSIATYMPVTPLTVSDIFNTPLTCSLFIEFCCEVFNQNVLTQEPSHENHILSFYTPQKNSDPILQDHFLYKNSEGIPMSELEHNHEEYLNTRFVDISAVGSSIVEDSLKSKVLQKTPEFINANEEFIFATLKTTDSGMTRSELVEITGIAWTTIFDCLQRLLLRGLVKCSPQHAGKVGRPKVYYQSCAHSSLTT